MRNANSTVLGEVLKDERHAHVALLAAPSNFVLLPTQLSPPLLGSRYTRSSALTRQNDGGGGRGPRSAQGQLAAGE